MLPDKKIDPQNKFGSIEVICGSMFSGKTEELLRRINRAKFAKLKIEVYKPIMDVRYDKKKVVSHDQNSIDSIGITKSSEILTLMQDPDIIAIDECQFFKDDIATTCNKIANFGIRVIVAGLDMDFLGNPFGGMPKLLSIAERITKVHAICIDCGQLANHSFRKNNQVKLISLGEKNNYKPLCRSCFQKNMRSE